MSESQSDSAQHDDEGELERARPALSAQDFRQPTPPAALALDPRVSEQARYRGWVGASSLALIWASVLLAGSPFGPFGLVCLAVCSCLSALYLAGFSHLIAKTASLSSDKAILLAATLDPLALSINLPWIGEPAALLFCVYLFIILDFGFRFGAPAMRACQASATVGFLACVALSPIWISHLSVALAFLILLTAAPLYAGALINKARAERERAETLARFDPLTGLPNRLHFNERLSDALARSARGGQLMALAFVDVDGFKALNDELGQEVGDAALRELSLRLKRCVRSTDAVCRLGGDTFAIVLEGLRSTADADHVAGKIMSAMRPAFRLGAEPRPMTVSAGLSFPNERDAQDTASALRQRSDAALRLAKESGRDTYRVIV